MATRSKAKAENRRQNRDARPFAVAKYIRIAPSKVHVVLDVIRGKGYNEAVAILMNTPKAASEPVLKVLNSAAANAEVNKGLNRDNLFVAECYADPTKAKNELGWVAEYGIEEMCADSWNWQKNNPDGYGNE